jgi:hypothetical protein
LADLMLGAELRDRLAFQAFEDDHRFGFASHFRRCMADLLRCQPQYTQFRSPCLNGEQYTIVPPSPLRYSYWS